MPKKAKRSRSDDGLVRLDPYELKRLRLARGWTIEQFARETGLHKRTADKVFHGGRIQMAVAQEVAAVFGVGNLLQIIDPAEYDRPSADASSGEGGHPVRGTTEWEAPLEAVTEIITTSNRLQYRVYKLRHRHESTRLGRGKRYVFYHMASDAEQRLRHCLLRHLKVCDAVAGQPAFPVCYGSFPDERQNAWWVVDEWIEGPTLDTLLKRGPLRAEVQADVMKRIAQGLKVMHDAGIVRRELSPGSIIIRQADQSPVLTDFELAKILEGNPTVSKDWEDDPYRAEEVRSGDVGTQADLYSWARILVHVVLGKLPSPGEDIEAIQREALPKPVVRVVAQCLARPRSKRPETMDVVLRAIRSWR